MTVTGGTVSWTKIWVVVGFLSTPAFLLIRGSQAIVDKLDVVIVKQDKADTRMDKFEEKQNAMSIRIDTMAHRQEINNITNNFRYQLQQQPTHYTYRTQHMDANRNPTMVR
jgi:hypothetical protein